MIDMFTAEDIAEDPHHPDETLAQWLARKLGETEGDARRRLAAMQRARAEGAAEGGADEGASQEGLAA